MSPIVFLIFAAIAVISAMTVVFAKNPVHSVLALIITFFSIAGLYLLMNAQFLFIVQIIVYAGAIMVLFLFVLMLLNLNADSEPQKSGRFRLIATFCAGLLMLAFAAAMKIDPAMAEKNVASVPEIGLVKNLGKVLFTDYLVPFEISSILFLAGMVGAVLLGKRTPKDVQS
jgi:NADH-quinone oxidoreductase subunit J